MESSGDQPVNDSSPPSSRPRRNRRSISYADLENGETPKQVGIDFHEMLQKYEDKFLGPEEVVTFCDSGSHLNAEYFESHGFDKPIVVQNVETLEGFRIPDRTTFGVNDVMTTVGPKVELDAIDVASQTEVFPKLTLTEWAEYFATPQAERRRIMNVISLEFSDSSLRNMVTSPKFVREVDWIDTVWPRDIEEHAPKVQYYCLMSVAGSYTDFHVDFGGSSVWYHILRGQKEFFLIEPNEENLKLFEDWLTCERQSFIFFAEKVKKCYRLKLKAGQTLLIPTGWIHAVYTPVDSLVFGGNFLLSRNMALQIAIYDIELRSRVPDKFRFPMYERMNWYAAKRFVDRFDAAAAPLGALHNLHSEPASVTPLQVAQPAIPLLDALASASLDASRSQPPQSLPDHMPTRSMLPYEVNALRCLQHTLARWLATPAHHDPPPLAIGDPQALLARLDSYLTCSASLLTTLVPLAQTHIPQLKLRLRIPAPEGEVKQEEAISWLEPERAVPSADPSLKIKVKMGDVPEAVLQTKKPRARRRVRDEEEEEFLIASAPAGGDEDDDYAGEGASEEALSSDSDRQKRQKEKRLRRKRSSVPQQQQQLQLGSAEAEGTKSKRPRNPDRLKGFIISDSDASGSDYSIVDGDDDAEYKRVSSSEALAPLEYHQFVPYVASVPLKSKPPKPKVEKEAPKKKTTVRDRLSQKLGITKSNSFKPMFRR